MHVMIHKENRFMPSISCDYCGDLIVGSGNAVWKGKELIHDSVDSARIYHYHKRCDALRGDRRKEKVENFECFEDIGVCLKSTLYNTVDNDKERRAVAKTLTESEREYRSLDI
jgi:hypothetical protein